MPEQTPFVDQEPNKFLRQHFQQGVDLLRARNWRAAVDHFENQRAAQKSGTRVKIGNSLLFTRPLNRASARSLYPFTEQMAAFSAQGTNPSRAPTVGETPAIHLVGVVFTPLAREKSEPVVVDRLYHNAALLHAEEWAHYVSGQVGPLAGKKNHEHDWSAFLEENHIPLTHEYRALRKQYYGMGLE